MKGTLTKTEQGWMVEYMAYDKTPIGHKSWWERLPLYPSDHITNKTQRVEGKEVEFEIVNETYEDGKGCTYAKLINVDKLGNEDVPKLGYDVEKLANEYASKASEIDAPYANGLFYGFNAGYNKAKETLYTEEQVREAIDMARSQSGYASYEYKENEIIQSLKQPKQ